MDLSSTTMRQNDPYSFHGDSGGEEDLAEYRRPTDYPDRRPVYPDHPDRRPPVYPDQRPADYPDQRFSDDSKDAGQQQSSRRKQSKPIRVQHLEAEAQNVVRVEPESPEHQRAASTPYEQHSCTDCPEQFGNADSLREHRDLVHGRRTPEQNHQSFPTDYHRLGRELSENDENTTEWPADYNPEDGIPVDRRSDKKIFHQDAFCDICDREFCNKYFLKTHMANKHGIYEDLPPPYSQAHLNPAAMFPMYLHGTPSMAPPRGNDRSPQDDRQSPLNMSVTPTSTSSPTSKPGTPGAYGASLFSKSPSSRENDPYMRMPGDSPSKSPAIAQDGSIDVKDKQQRSMDDFCEMCQKHFCNKYYLRKHKMDVHGIQSEPYSAKRRHSSSLLSMTNPVLLPQNMPTSMANMMLMNPFGPMFPNPMFPMPHMPGMPELPPHMKSPREPDRSAPPEPTIKNPDAYCDICRKEFCDKYYLKVHKANMHNIQEDNSHSLPTFVPQRQPSLDARSLEMARNLDRDRFAREKHEAKFDHKPEIKADHFEREKYDREKFDARFEAEYQRRYLEAKQESREREDRKREETPMDFSNQENSERRRTPPSSMPSIPTSAPSVFDSRMDPGRMDPGRMDLGRMDPSRMDPSRMDPRMEPRPEQPPRIEHRPRKCDVCHKEFADKYALRIHRLNIHGLVHGQPAPSQDQKPEPKAERHTPPGYGSTFSPHTPPKSFGLDLPPSTIPMPMSSLPFPPHSNSLTTSSDNPMSTMFSSMVTAKLADRVTCDICNKEVCNKYFLKTHKIKMHGVDPASVGKEPPKEPKKPKQPISPLTGPLLMTNQHKRELFPENRFPEHRFPENRFPETRFPELPRTPIKPMIEDPPIDPARNEELLKMGIDPEAYCEICKKEFCSKYFLRTHKLNMHGIPTDKPGNRKEDREISRREIMERELMAMRDFGVFPGSMGSMYPSMPVMPGLPPPPMHPSTYPFPGLPSMNQIRQADEESLDSNKSKDSNKSNKEPANAIRVKCEICGKELCNKYFLRTHKLNKHGIVDDTLSEGQQRKFLELQQKGLLPENPFVFKDGILPENLIKRDPDQAKGLNGGIFSSLDPNILGPNFNQTFLQGQKDEKDELDDANLLREFSEVCNVCQRRFTSVEWLKTHMSVEHGMKSEHDTELIRKKMELACQACGMLFPDKIGLQIHLVQEHGVGINLTPEPTAESREKIMQDTQREAMDTDNNNLSLKVKRKYSKIMVKRKIHTCSKCEYRTLFIKNLLNHEERSHGIKSKRFRCKNCFKRFKIESALRQHVHDCREKKVEVQNGQFHCKLCSETFVTRRACRLHILNSHTDKFRCSDCGFQAENQKRLSFHCRLKHGIQRPALQPVNGHLNGVDEEKMPVCYSTPCDLKSQASFIMQPFTLRDENGFNHFVKAVVYLPVYQKINEPMTVDFHLTPTDK